MSRSAKGASKQVKVEAQSPAKSDRQRVEILRAAATLFAEKGYGGTRMHHIAEAVNLTRTAFYYYFKNKEELLASLVDDVTFTLQRRSTGLVEQKHLSPPKILESLVKNYASLVMDMAVEFRFVSRTEADFPRDIAAAHDRAKRQVLDSFIEVIRRGVDRGAFDVPDARVVSLAIIGMCNWSAWWFRADGKLSATQVADMFAELALEMVGSQAVVHMNEDEIRQEVFSLRRRLSKLDRLIKAG